MKNVPRKQNTAFQLKSLILDLMCGVGSIQGCSCAAPGNFTGECHCVSQ